MDEINYHFDNFFVQTSTRRLLNNGNVLDISSKGFDILLYLIQKRGKVVTKDEIFDEIWGETFVEESNLPVHISALRRILGEKRGESRFIKTISGKGYIFVAPVEERGTVENFPANEKPDGAVEKKVQPISIAVLPFHFPGENEEFVYLAEGITQSLIDNLSQTPNFKIISFSGVKEYKKSTLNLREIGFQLGVDKILQGNVKPFKSRVEISLELVNVADLTYLWGTEFQCKLTDILTLKNELSLLISQKLKPQLNSFEKNNLANTVTTNSNSFQLFQKGKHILESFPSSTDRHQSLKTAAKYFQDAIKLDPNFALAFIYLGRTYFFLGYNSFIPTDEAEFQAKLLLKSALNLNDKLSEAFELKGIFDIFYDFDFLSAERHLLKSLNLNHNNAYSLHMLSLLQTVLQKHDESIQTQIKAIQLSPSSISYNVALANRFYFAGEFQKAIIQAEETLDLDPNSAPAYLILSLAHAETGNFAEAFRNIKKARQIFPGSLEYILTEIYIFGSSGNQTKAEKMLNQILSKKTESNVNFYSVPHCFCSINKFDEALDWIEQIDLSKAPLDLELFLFRIDPRLKSIWQHPRFISFVEKLNSSPTN